MARRKARITSPATHIGSKFCDLLILWLLITFLLLGTACNDATIPISSEPAAVPTISSPSIEYAPVSPSLQLSAGQQLRFEHISLEQGLSQSTVYSMLQGSHGFMWFGTEDGLNKYDGYTFTVYKHDPENPNSLSDDWIQAMFEDSSGTLWIGTSDGGLNRYDRKLDQFTHYQNDPRDPSSLSDDEITAIYQDQDGILWIGTGSGGLDRLVPREVEGPGLNESEGLDQENEQFIHYQHDPNNPNSLSSNAISAIYEDREGTLWIGTEDGGLNRLVLSKAEGFERENERWWHYGNDPSDPHSLSHNNITAISEDQSGALWVGTGGGGLDKLVLSHGDASLSDANGVDHENEQFIHYQHDPDDPESLSSDEIATIYQDRDGALWIGTRGGGLNSLVPETETFAHYQNIPGDPRSLSNNFVVSIFQDREGILWFGTRVGGINKLLLGGLNFAYFNYNPNDPNSLSNKNISGIYQDQSGMLWVATDGGLNSLDQKTGQWRHYQHDPNDPYSLSSNVLLDIYEDQAGLLWIGTYDNGLNSFDPETERFTRYQEDPNDPSSFKGLTVTEIYQDSQGILWIGSLGGGLNKYDQERGSFTHFQTDPNDPESINSNSIFSIYEDQQGLLWIGTLGDGLIKFDRENEKFTHVQSDSKDSSSLSNNFVVSIFQDSEGILWFGTAGGLNKFDPQKGTFTQYREKDGLPNDWVYGILEDEQGNLWLSTNNGLSKFNSHTETFKNFDVSDGLQSNEFNGLSYHKSNSGEMFFGGINGFNVFFPNQIMENPTIPPIVLTSLAQDGEQVDLGIAVDSVTEVTLKWPDNSFEFEFAALSFAHPEKNQYAYYLEGFEETWNEVGTRRYGQYTRLPGGNYTLRVKGSNNDGIWNEVGTAVEITIVPPFWDTWWFRGVVFLAVLGTIFGGYRLRVRSLEARSRELESRFEQRTAELLETQDALRQSELEKAITEERSRLAREMHDSVTQSLYSLTLFSHAARRMAEDIGDDRLGRQIGQIGTTAVKALKEMRLLVYELRPRVLKKEGLIRALRQRLEAVEGRSGVEARLMVDDLVRLPRSVEQELYRIANEALNNTLKHAAATSVVVYLRELDGRIELEVVDDGIGFEPDVMPDHGGMGLESIRERAERLGGKAIIRSAPGEGTSVKVTMNLEEEPVEPAVFQEEDSHE